MSYYRDHGGALTAAGLVVFGGLLAVFLAGCATSAPKKPVASAHPMEKGAAFERVWQAATKVTARYFPIERVEEGKGIIVTAVRTDRDEKGTETKRAMIGVFRDPAKPSEYDVRVKVPYLSYDKYENVYGEALKDGKTSITVERKKLEPPADHDIYLETLLKSEILKEAAKAKN